MCVALRDGHDKPVPPGHHATMYSIPGLVNQLWGMEDVKRKTKGRRRKEDVENYQNKSKQTFKSKSGEIIISEYVKKKNQIWNGRDVSRYV